MKKTSITQFVYLLLLFSMIALLLFGSGWFHAAFTAKDTTGIITGGHGGMIGKGIGGAVLALLDKIPASILLFVIVAFAFMFAFGISPKDAVMRLFRRG